MDKKKEILIAEQCNEWMKTPIKETAIMFIENYNMGASGNVFSIFKQYVNDEKYSDYTFVWSVRDYSSIDYINNESSGRDIWFVVPDGHDFIRFLFTAKIIITGVFLPNYYIKRDSQTIHTVFNDILLYNGRYDINSIKNFVKTINNTDVFLCNENRYSAATLNRRYGIPFSRIRMYSKEITKGRKKILVSLENKNRALKSVPTFLFIYRVFKGIADYYDADIVFKVDYKFYNDLFEDEYYSSTIEDVYSDEKSAISFINDIDYLISDNLADISLYMDYVEYAIFFSSAKISKAYNRIMNRIVRIRGFEFLVDYLEGLLSNRLDLRDNLQFNNRVKLLDCPSELRAIEVTNTDSNKHREKVLVVVQWHDLIDYGNELNTLFSDYDESFEITLLFRSSKDGLLYNSLNKMLFKNRIACRTGKIQCNSNERTYIFEQHKKGQILSPSQESVAYYEWIRMLGTEEFDLMIAVENKDRLWNFLYEKAPAKKVVFFPARNPGKTIDRIRGILEKELKTASEREDNSLIIDESSVDGEDNDEIYM